MYKSIIQGLFGTQKFHRDHAGISKESIQFHWKNAGRGKNPRVLNRPTDGAGTA
jgi:hypothetical protein